MNRSTHCDSNEIQDLVVGEAGALAGDVVIHTVGGCGVNDAGTGSGFDVVGQQNRRETVVERIEGCQRVLETDALEGFAFGQSLMDQIAPFRRLDYEFKKILEFQFIAFRFGRIAREHYQKLERYIMIRLYAIFPFGLLYIIMRQDGSLVITV